MSITFSPLMGMGVGIEFTEARQSEHLIHYCLIDIVILRVQIAWFGKESS